MNERTEQLFNPYGPVLNQQVNITVAASSAHLDLSSDADLAPLVNAITAGLLLEISADGDVGYRWSTAASGETVAITATTTVGTAAHQCKVIYAGERTVERAVRATLGLVTIGAVATILRITICSRQANTDLKLNP